MVLTNVVIDGCIVNFLVGYPVNSTPNTTNLFLRNNIIYGFIHANNATFDNNVFLATSTTGTVFYSIYAGKWYYTDYCLFRNNIIKNGSSSYGLSQHNIFYNNIFTDSISVQTATAQNNVSQKPLSTIFQSVNNTSKFNPSDNFHLKSGSPAISAGINNIDCGVYGGSSPFKEGMVPYNPHIQSADIASSTDQNGNLKVNIKVRAQSR